MARRRQALSADWRTQIDRELLHRYKATSGISRPLSDDEWAAVLDDGTFGELNERRKSAASVADKVALWRRAHNINERLPVPFVSSPHRQRGSRHLAWHQAAVSDVLACHAEQETQHRFGVREFRNDLLGGRLLPIDHVARWVEEHATRDGPAVAATRFGSDGSKSRGVETLGYARPGSDWMHRVAVRTGGTLDRLRVVAKRLENFYDWDEAQATVFVLTGLTPLIHAIRATVTTSSPLLVRSRIKLSIDPSTTPREVADYFRHVRQEGFGRIRRLGEKHARLAAFVVRLPDGLTSAEQMRQWNEHCVAWKRRKWRFKHPSRFSTEAQRSLDRLVELGKA